ncbi:Transport permease protein OS=Streptomyces tendae OX=1932 GN=GUR47_07445 PE=3 SV=1 [Streptomyces tendae]
MFNAGVAMVMARVGSKIPDMAQLMRPAAHLDVRLGRHVQHRAHDRPGQRPAVLGRHRLQLNPAVVYIDLMRFALIDTFGGGQLPPHVWALAVGWALVAGIGGFIYFWKAEETYGRG